MASTHKIPWWEDPAHPWQRLSKDARQRVMNAHEEGELVMDRMLATVHTRWMSEHDLSPSQVRALTSAATASDVSRLLEGPLFQDFHRKSFEDYCAKEGAVELSNAKMEAVRIGLSVIKNEIAAVTSGIELWHLMQDQVDAACQEVHLTDPQQNVIWGELRPGLYAGTAISAPPTAMVTRTRKTPHENPESALKGKSQVTKEIAGVILGLSKRAIRNLIDEGKLSEQGEGYRKMITVASLRARIKSQRKTE